ncbi:FHA domain-containing protein [bacterium]|nr:FHA domain-containing protein [bacterium]
MNFATLTAIAAQLTEAGFVGRFPHPILLVRKSLAQAEAFDALDWKGRTHPSGFNTSTGSHSDRHTPPAPASVELLVKSPRNPFGAMITVGRAPNNDVCFTASSVSKLHAYFQQDGNRWLLRDGTSSNGTFLNGERLKPNVAVPVEDGAHIAFGPDMECLFKLPGGLYRYLKQVAAEGQAGAKPKE